MDGPNVLNQTLQSTHFCWSQLVALVMLMFPTFGHVQRSPCAGRRVQESVVSHLAPVRERPSAPRAGLKRSVLAGLAGLGCRNASRRCGKRHGLQRSAALSVEPTMKFEEWRGHQIRCITAAGDGSKQIQIVLVHGFGGSIEYWRRLFPALSEEGYTVHAFDLLGLGLSEKPQMEYSIELWAEQVKDFLTKLGTENAVTAANFGSAPDRSIVCGPGDTGAMSWVGSVCSPSRSTKLAEYAASVASRSDKNNVARGLLFPMYVVAVDLMLRFSDVRPHEELLAEGLLTVFVEAIGQAIFVSHQWLSAKHPDPKGLQFRVLQDALRNILSGASKISIDVSTEIFFGRPAINSAAKMRSTPLFLWYDYFSCPQQPESKKLREDAIQSIPEYIAKCEHFMVLTPPLNHVEQAEMLSRYSWSERGWCRAERMARELSSAEGLVILVQNSTQQTLLPQYESVLYSPGKGHFTVENDREKIAVVTKKMVLKKLMGYLERGDLHNYRFFLNQQPIRLHSLPAKPWNNLVPDFQTEIDPAVDPKGFALAIFMHQNGFLSITEYDEGGWSPLCFAAMNGDPVLVSALLEKKASPNDATKKSKLLAHMPNQMTVLGLATCFRNNEALSVLLEAKAQVNGRDARGDGALHWACVSDNAEGVRILLEAGHDPFMLAGPGASPWATACSTGSIRAAKELLHSVKGLDLRHSFFWCLMFHGGSKAMVNTLIDSGADMDERYYTDFTNPAMWMVLRMYSLKHYWSPSRLTLLAHHHFGATPLMFSVMNGHFEAAIVLVKAGARLDLRNARGKTACDLARDMQAPSDLVVLVGNSFGSLISLLAASEQRPKGIVMLNCAVGMNNKNMFFAKLALGLVDLIFRSPILDAAFKSFANKEQVSALLKNLYPTNPAAVDDELAEGFVQPSKTPGALDVLRQIYTGNPGPTPMEILDGGRMADLPMKVIWGDQDTLTPIKGDVGSFLTELAKERSSIDFEIISAGHLPHDENPEAVNKAVLTWLAKEPWRRGRVEPAEVL
eukprot:s1283_g18.t1